MWRKSQLSRLYKQRLTMSTNFSGPCFDTINFLPYLVVFFLKKCLKYVYIFFVRLTTEKVRIKFYYMEHFSIRKYFLELEDVTWNALKFSGPLLTENFNTNKITVVPIQLHLCRSSCSGFKKDLFFQFSLFFVLKIYYFFHPDLSLIKF